MEVLSLNWANFGFQKSVWYILVLICFGNNGQRYCDLCFIQFFFALKYLDICPSNVRWKIIQWKHLIVFPFGGRVLSKITRELNNPHEMGTLCRAQIWFYCVSIPVSQFLCNMCVLWQNRWLSTVLLTLFHRTSAMCTFARLPGFVMHPEINASLLLFGWVWFIGPVWRLWL